MTRERLVVDTNVFVSGILSSTAPPARVVERAIEHGHLLGSTDTMRELIETLLSPKFRSLCVAPAARSPARSTGTALSRWSKSSSRSVPAATRRTTSSWNWGSTGRPTSSSRGTMTCSSLHPFRSVDILSPAAYLERGPKGAE